MDDEAEKRPRGHPRNSIPTVSIHLRLPLDIVQAIDETRQAAGNKRPHEIVRWLTDAVTARELKTQTQLDASAPTTEIEITPEMIAAGVWVLEQFGVAADNEFLVRRIGEEMMRAAPSTKPQRKHG